MDSDHSHGKSLTFCIVDDSPIDRFVAEHVIKSVSTDLGVKHYATSQAVLDGIAKGEFENCIVLLDIQMPIMNGWELARQMRESGVTSPIYVLTALLIPDGYAKEHLDQYTNGTFLKPINPQDVSKMIISPGGIPIL